MFPKSLQRHGKAAQLIGIVMTNEHTYNKLKYHGFVDALKTNLAWMSSDPGIVDGEEFLTNSFVFLQARAELLPFLREMVASLRPNSLPYIYNTYMIWWKFSPFDVSERKVNDIDSPGDN